MDNYILDGHEPVVEPDLMKWAAWLENNDRKVAQTKVGKVKISTVFLGLDHSYGESGPILFETMVFGGTLDQEMQRYATWAEAEKGHKEWIEKVKKIS